MMLKKYLGIDYIGGANYIDKILRYHPIGYAAGFLCRASGWSSGLVAARQLAKTGHTPYIRIHGIWHDDHVFKARDIDPAVDIAKRIARFADRYPKIQIRYSPWLEHNASPTLFKRVKRACKNVLPKRVRVVSAIMNRNGHINKRGYYEVHGMSGCIRKPYIFSYDGQDAFASDIAMYKNIHAQAETFFLWIPGCNGKAHLNDNTARHLRTHWLTENDFRKFASLRRLWSV